MALRPMATLTRPGAELTARYNIGTTIRCRGGSWSFCAPLSSLTRVVLGTFRILEP